MNLVIRIINKEDYHHLSRKWVKDVDRYIFNKNSNLTEIEHKQSKYQRFEAMDVIKNNELFRNFFYRIWWNERLDDFDLFMLVLADKDSTLIETLSNITINIPLNYIVPPKCKELTLSTNCNLIIETELFGKEKYHKGEDIERVFSLMFAREGPYFKTWYVLVWESIKKEFEETSDKEYQENKEIFKV